MLTSHQVQVQNIFKLINLIKTNYANELPLCEPCCPSSQNPSLLLSLSLCIISPGNNSQTAAWRQGGGRARPQMGDGVCVPGIELLYIQGVNVGLGAGVEVWWIFTKLEYTSQINQFDYSYVSNRLLSLSFYWSHFFTWGFNLRTPHMFRPSDKGFNLWTSQRYV